VFPWLTVFLAFLIPNIQMPGYYLDQAATVTFPAAAASNSSVWMILPSDYIISYTDSVLNIQV